MEFIMGKDRVLNIAHRGARSLAPENTLVAARAALDVGADMWETDVGVTGDEVLILFHDSTLVRTTNAQFVFPDRAPWTYSNFSYAELQRLDAGSWFAQTDPFGQIKSGKVPREKAAAFRGEKIPTLDQALRFTRESGWRINIELKRLPPPLEKFPVVERVLALIDTLNLDPRTVVLSSFEHAWLKQVRRHRPELAIQAVVGLSRVKPIKWEPLEFGTYNVRYNLVKEAKIRMLSQKGVAVNVWAVNEEMDMQRLINAGVSGIITDFPQRLARLQKEN
jgi:glycerophosphoryl diester phosphodiesterase